MDKSWLKMPKMVHFGEFLKTWSLWSNSVTRGQKENGGKCQNWKIIMRDFEYFSNFMFMLRFFICVLIAQSSCEEGDRQSHHHYIAKRYVTSINFSLIDWWIVRANFCLYDLRSLKAIWQQNFVESVKRDELSITVSLR